VPLVASPQGRSGSGPGTTTYVGPPPLPDGLRSFSRVRWQGSASARESPSSARGRANRTRAFARASHSVHRRVTGGEPCTGGLADGHVHVLRDADRHLHLGAV